MFKKIIFVVIRLILILPLMLTTGLGLAISKGSAISPPQMQQSTKHQYLPLVTQDILPTGIYLDYFINVPNYQTIKIKLTIYNATNPTFTIYRLATPVMEALPPTSELAIVDQSGHPVNFTITNWEGSADRHFERLDITPNNAKKIIVTYTLDLQSQKYWQVVPEYIAISENQILFQPDGDHQAIQGFGFQFSLPPTWKVITRLTPISPGLYSGNPKDTTRVVTQNYNYQRFFFGAPLVLGLFEQVEKQFGDIRSIAAYPSGNAQYANDASYVEKIFSYQENFMGHPTSNKGDIAFLYVFGPQMADGGLIPTIGTNHGTFEVSHVDGDRHLGHEMFHMWYGDGNWLPDAWRFFRIPDWFSEGTNEYLGVNVHYATGAFTLAMANQWHVDFYNNYKAIAGTALDVPISRCQELLPPRDPAWVTCLYSKSHNVFFLMDQVLKQKSGGTVGLENFIRYLLDNYSSNPVQIIDENQLQNAVTTFSGYDFKLFFDAYVTGNVLLPIDVQNGALVVLWDQLPNMPKK